MKTELPSAEEINRNILLTGGSPLSTSPKVYVYKTKADYDHLVPVIMNDSRTSIVSYPHPTDLKKGGGYTYPSKLRDGYLLDNRGINKNVVFLNYTYEEYATLSDPISVQHLMGHIADKYPLVEMYECGHRIDYKNIEKELNEIIVDSFPNCIRIIDK